jgi:hypothetical protein
MIFLEVWALPLCPTAFAIVGCALNFTTECSAEQLDFSGGLWYNMSRGDISLCDILREKRDDDDQS